MGLDMYLEARTHCGSSDFVPPDEKIQFALLEKEFVAEQLVCPEFKFAKVEFVAIYWRKANQIHKWFVDNVQGGHDNCACYHVSTKQLQELEALCLKALETKDPELLPPMSGFFFGSTDVDEFYWGDIEYTLKALQRIKPFGNRFDYEYHSSW